MSSDGEDDEAYISGSSDMAFDERWDTKHLPILTFPIDSSPNHNSSGDSVNSCYIKLRQNANSYCHGLTVWDASKVLLKYIERLFGKSPKNKLFVKGGDRCRWLELGSGCGLLGIGISILGCAKEITVTDYGEVVTMLEENVGLNEELLKVPVIVKELFWGRRKDLENVRAPFDRIVCADVLYSIESAKLLTEAINDTSAEGTIVLVSYEQRDPRVAEAFIKNVADSGFYSNVQTIAHSKLDSHFQHDNINILQFKRIK